MARPDERGGRLVADGRLARWCANVAFSGWPFENMVDDWLMPCDLRA